MSKIAIALRKASNQYQHHQVADPEYYHSIEKLLNRKNNKFISKSPWLTCVLAFFLVFVVMATMIYNLDWDRQVLKNISYHQNPSLVNPDEKSQSFEDKNQDASPNTKLNVSVSSPFYTIQVGSYLYRHNAEATLKKLREKAYPAVTMSKFLNAKGTWYRVCVGEFQAKRQADRLLARLQRDYADSFVLKTRNHLTSLSRAHRG